MECVKVSTSDGVIEYYTKKDIAIEIFSELDEIIYGIIYGDSIEKYNELKNKLVN